MNKILTVITLSSLLFLASCGSSNKTPDTLEGKKKMLADLKDKQAETAKQIDSLQNQISRLDTSSKVAQKAKLVALSAVATGTFTHYIELQGNVEAENTSSVAPRGGPGIVRSVLVKQGDNVRQGQLLLKLDDIVQRTNIANVQIQLDHAKDLYQRRKNLWDQKIGTEVDLINAKNAVDQAETQMKLAQEQLNFTNVYADLNGTADVVNIKVGEMFAGNGQIHLISTSSLKTVVQVPEIYQERVKVGTPVKITFPGLNNKEVTGTVRVAGKSINSESRSFSAEIKLPNSTDIRANQVALVRLQDYNVAKTLTIPVNTLQTDDKGKYVMVAVKDKENNLTAHKKSITIGQSYGDKVEITGGLQEGEQLITDGFQGLYEGQLITIQ